MTDSKRAPYTLFLVGAGADEGGWRPVFDAINEATGTKLVSSVDDANVFLSQHVYGLRLGPAFERLGQLPPESVAAQKKEGAEWDRKLKAAIANHLKQATSSGAMRLRPRFLEALKEPRFSPRRLFLTANWDLLLERELGSSKEIFHFHGDVNDPGNLFLPSEITPEEYRTKEQHDAMGKSVAALWQTVADAEDICIFGLSLSPLDAEVAFTIGLGIQHRPDLKRQITIFGLEGDTKLIESRLTLLSRGNANLEFKHEPQPRDV
ncbi:hypothetical protein ATI61_11427 [Archangium gephyra]|uniref:SIR2-like domain-containing protein n=1 Tax=Archangium gephyra TaxID=48 RepID=A0ABX9JQ95_9BACT|nr:hypothetical protein [Archangium gephyra]REG24419.1 hypothetical protein ATI61_11427 [Archangium gephyra]